MNWKMGKQGETGERVYRFCWGMRASLSYLPGDRVLLAFQFRSISLKKYNMFFFYINLMNESIAIPVIFSASAAFSSSCATALTLEDRARCMVTFLYSISSLSSPKALRSCCMYSVMALKYLQEKKKENI